VNIVGNQVRHRNTEPIDGEGTMSDEKQTTDVAGLDEIIPAREATPFQKAASGEKVERPARPESPRKLPFSVSGLIACMIAAAAIWIAYAQSHRMDELENQMAIMHAQMARTHEAMALLNNRQTEIEQHLDDLVRLKGIPEEATNAHKDTDSETTSPEPASSESSPNTEASPSQTESEKTAAASAKMANEAKSSATAEPAATSQPSTESTPAVTSTPSKDDSITTQPAPRKTARGPWKVNLVSGTSEAAIQKETKRLQSLGVPVTYTSLQIKDKTWYRIYIPGFASKKDAQQEAAALKKKLNMEDIWVGK